MSPVRFWHCVALKCTPVLCLWSFTKIWRRTYLSAFAFLDAFVKVFLRKCKMSCENSHPTSQLWNLHSHAIFQCNAKPAWSPNEINLRPPICQWPDISEQGAHACAIDIVILTFRCGAGMHFHVCMWTKCACLVCPYTGSATYKLCRVLLCHLLPEECSSVCE